MTPPMVSSETLHAFFREVFHLQRRLAPLADEIHDRSGLGTPQRHILAFLDDLGSESVPNMARHFGVSRQHIQENVHGLVERGFVRLVCNPNHKKSPLVELTIEGKGALEKARREENDRIVPLTAFLEERDVFVATKVLRLISAHLGERERQAKD